MLYLYIFENLKSHLMVAKKKKFKLFSVVLPYRCEVWRMLSGCYTVIRNGCGSGAGTVAAASPVQSPVTRVRLPVARLVVGPETGGTGSGTGSGSTGSANAFIQKERAVTYSVFSSLNKGTKIECIFLFSNQIRRNHSTLD